jgi:cysteine synthase
VTIFVPRGNSVEKNASMRALGASVFEVGDDFEEARAASVADAAKHNLEPVPPFHRDLVLGVASYARELFDGAGPLDTVYVPIGMGSGINAIIAVRYLLDLSTKVVGVVSENAAAAQLSFAAGEVVQTPTAATFVDGVATRSPDPQSMPGVIAGAARVIAVSDDAVAEAMRVIYRTTHNVAESAGAISLAGSWLRPRQNVVGTVHSCCAVAMSTPTNSTRCWVVARGRCDGFPSDIAHIRRLVSAKLTCMTSRFRFRAFVVAASLALVACGASDDTADKPAPTVEESAEPEADGVPDTVADVVPAADPEADPEPEPEPAPAPETAPEPAPEPESEPEAAESGSDDCLVGAWRITEAEMNAYYDALEANLASAGPAPTFDIAGEVLLTLTPTDYIYIADFDLTLDLLGQTGTGVASGTASGTWSSADSIITTELGSSDLDVVVTVAGITLSGSDFANGLLDSVPINNASFNCDGPTVSFQAGELATTRHDVTLTPA